ncbi:hypothetical protein [Mycoplasmoides alvi]|uniref:hypothetical protein n=1 Tax=Mycoplasmoides alvi TaxID=78580 RepID=UPI00051C53D3|nr:hypothetical protein [Mycoplasmoides alvi]
MNTQISEKSFNLNKNWNQTDLSYEYAKMAIKCLYSNKYSEQKLKDIINDYFLNAKNKPNLKFIDDLLIQNTKNYLILSKNIDMLMKLNELKKVEQRISLYFKVIKNALLEARKNDEYIIQVQFDFIELFLYANWFLNEPKEAIEIFNDTLFISFKYPDTTFQEQYEICIKTAKKIDNDNMENKNIAITLKNIFKHFIWNSKIINSWEKQINAPMNAEQQSLKNKIYEWILIHYLLPLYMCLNRYYKNDEKFKVICQKLYEYHVDNNLLLEIINWMINTIDLVNEIDNKQLNKFYLLVKKECEKLICKKKLFKNVQLTKTNLS